MHVEKGTVERRGRLRRQQVSGSRSSPNEAQQGFSCPSSVPAKGGDFKRPLEATERDAKARFRRSAFQPGVQNASMPSSRTKAASQPRTAQLENLMRSVSIGLDRDACV